MAKQAHNFAHAMALIWNGKRRGEENATVVALRQSAVKLRPVDWDGFINEPGDMPASLWQWSDGSDYLVLDDGSGIMPTRRRGQRRV